MATPQSRIESLLGIPMPRRPMPPARKAAPASAPMPSRAPERRAERIEPEKARPARRAEANTIRALVIDPQARTVTEVRIATEPGDERGGFGVQAKEGAVAKIVGSDDIEWLDLRDGEVVMVDALRQSETAETWRFGDDDEPIAGKGVIVGHDPEADAYSDTELSLDEARKSIVWGDEDDEGARVELISRIVDRLEGMDSAQLTRLRAQMDDGGDAAGEDAEAEPSAYRDNGNRY